jgi:hypothetical protein
MSGSANYERTISVGMKYNSACGMFALTSPDLPGLLLAGKDPDALWDDVPAVVRALYKVSYNMDVQVVMESRPEVEGLSFVPLQPATLLKVQPRPM